MTQPNFLTDNIPHEYILLPNIKHAFGPEGVGLKWSLEECEFKRVLTNISLVATT